jgi:hypothetical protein
MFAALYTIFGQTTLVMDRERGILRRALFGFKHDKKFALSEVTAVRVVEAYKQNSRPVYAVAILRDGADSPSDWKTYKRQIAFGTDLSEEERAWLAGEIHAFWKEMLKNK